MTFLIEKPIGALKKIYYLESLSKKISFNGSLFRIILKNALRICATVASEGSSKKGRRRNGPRRRKNISYLWSKNTAKNGKESANNSQVT